MSGFTRTELLAMDFWNVAHPDRDMIKGRGMAHVRGVKKFTRYEFRFITENCEIRWVDMTVVLIEFEGKPAVIGNVFDITDCKRADEERERLNRQLQQALRSFKASEAKFRTLSETTTTAIFIHRGQACLCKPC
jgi:hypothetical protein